MADSVRIVLTHPEEPDHFLILTEVEDEPDDWKLPGGKFEGEENPTEAAGRELMEETGLTPEEVGLEGPIELPNNDGESKRYIFLGRIASLGVVQRIQDHTEQSEEVAQTKWVTIDTVPECKNRDHIIAAVAVQNS